MTATTLPQTLYIDTVKRERGDARAWVGRFAHGWEAPAQRLDELLALLGEDIMLRAPTRPPMTIGRDAGRRAFERVLHALPDLRAEVGAWSMSADTLFIEMTFHATIGGHRTTWRSVDRVRFSDGVARERIAYFDPTKVRRAFLRSPSAVWQLLRTRLSN